MTVLPRDHAWTVADLELLPDDGLRYLQAVTTTLALAVEVLSPSSRSVDLVLKRELYRQAGVQSYWVLDPVEPSAVSHQPSADIWQLAGGQYGEPIRVTGEDMLDLTLPYALVLRPADLLR